MSPFSLLVRSSVGQGAECVIGASVDHLVPFTPPHLSSSAFTSWRTESESGCRCGLHFGGNTKHSGPRSFGIYQDPLVYIGVQVNSSGERLQIDIFFLFFKGIVIK